MFGAGESAGAIAGVVMLIVGVPLRIGSVIAAPLVAAQHNRELRLKAGLIAFAAGAPAWQAPPTPPERKPQPSARNVVVAGVPVLAW
ncbi:MAG: hypothetical protein HY906_22585 [Deltaproteobacteria bacterium]|nr:hypothetical protein [Deltaproteobacteria bacterium]